MDYDRVKAFCAPRLYGECMNAVSIDMSKRNREKREQRRVKTEPDYGQRSMAAVPTDIFVKAFEHIVSKWRALPEDADATEQLIWLHRHTREFCTHYGIDLHKYAPPLVYRFLGLLNTIDVLKDRAEFQRFLIHDRDGNIVGCDKASIRLAAEFPITSADEVTFPPELFVSKLQELCS